MLNLALQKQTFYFVPTWLLVMIGHSTAWQDLPFELLCKPTVQLLLHPPLFIIHKLQSTRSRPATLPVTSPWWSGTSLFPRMPGGWDEHFC